MTTTIELAGKAGFTAGRDDHIFREMLETFRALCVAERDRELMAVGCECDEVDRYLRNNLDDDDYEDFSRSLYEAIAAARLQGAEEERKKWESELVLHNNGALRERITELEADVSHKDEVITQNSRNAQRCITELEQQLAEKRERLSDAKVESLCAVGPVHAPSGRINFTPAQYRHELHVATIFGFRQAEAAHNIGGKHD